MNESQISNIKKLSHSINTPLTTILGYISLIKKKSKDEDVLEWVDLVKIEVLKVSKYSKEINEIVTKIRL